MSGKNLNIMVTSGGTRVPLDDVRVLTNLSKGTTGARIAEEALKVGHHVDYVHTAGATVLPFEQALKVDVGEDPEDEIARITQELPQIRELYRRLVLRGVSDFADYDRQLTELLKDQVFDAVFMAMAASDYGPKKEGGKISSDKDELIVVCQRLPKIIDRVKAIRRRMFLVGFKLLAESAGEDALLTKAHSIIASGKQDMVVANLVAEGFKPVLTRIVRKDHEVVPVPKRSDLAPMLIEQLGDSIN